MKVIHSYGLFYCDLTRPMLIAGYYGKKHAGKQTVFYNGTEFEMETTPVVTDVPNLPSVITSVQICWFM